tara:strand:- start:577 stop:897 length:321 start_codon:yes stop_codon:yes gene_type:complete
MKLLPDEILLHIMIFLGTPDMNKMKLYISKEIYDYIVNDILLEYIIDKVVKKTSNDHVLIELNPCKKVSLITESAYKIKKEVKRNFLENEKENLNLWIKKFYLKKV